MLTACRTSFREQESDDDLRRFDGHQLLRLVGRGTQVRRAEDARQLRQPVPLRRLVHEDVERRAGHVARFERVGQSVFVDDAAAGAVDDPHPLLHLRDPLRH